MERKSLLLVLNDYAGILNTIVDFLTELIQFSIFYAENNSVFLKPLKHRIVVKKVILYTALHRSSLLLVWFRDMEVNGSWSIDLMIHFFPKYFLPHSLPFLVLFVVKKTNYTFMPSCPLSVVVHEVQFPHCWPPQRAVSITHWIDSSLISLSLLLIHQQEDRK